MTQVIPFPERKTVSVIDKEMDRPKYGYQYLLMCKETLDINDYEEVLLSIMDKEYYNDADKDIRCIVDIYYTFDN